MNPRRPADDPQPRPGASAAATSPGAQPAPQRALKPVAAPAPSLPKGGGAIRGLGEKFSVNAATGTAGLQVPIATSPGRSGFHPELALSYDSGAGNGPFGVGWQLSVPQIARKTDKGLPRYDDARESDTFVLSGAEDLVPVLSENGTIDPLGNGGESVQRYRPRVEGAFARIERRQVAGGAPYWRVITRDNITHIYGRTEGARISEPGAPLRIFSWLLEESRDDRGNIITYEYKLEDIEGVPGGLAHEVHRRADGALVVKANRYLKRICYGNTAPGDPSTMLFEVVFDYGEHDDEAPGVGGVRTWPSRQDPFSDGRPGFEIRAYRLCRRVLMFHHMPELGPGPCLVRSTDFTYAESPILTRLVSVTHSGYIRVPATGAYQKKSLPFLEFGYSIPEIDTTLRFVDRESARDLGGALAGGLQWVDLDGEGLPGLLMRQAGALFYKRNMGGGSLGPARPLPTGPSLASGAFQVMDLNGDGQKEMVCLERPMAGYFERTEDGSWAPFRPLGSQPNINWSERGLQFIDLNGDGHEDVVLTRNGTIVWYPSLAKGGFGKPITVPAPRDGDRGHTVVFGDGIQTIFLADMTGDGLADLVRVTNGGVCYWPNLGHGRFGAKVTMSNAPWLDYPDKFDLRRVRLADVDGSGTTDLLYIHGRGVRLYINHSGNAFGPATELPSFPDHSLYSTIAALDLLGTGTACLVWSTPLPGWASAPLRYIDLLGGKKPYLLTSVKNNMGLETQLQYAPSTKFYLADQAAGRPWVTRLPFPVHVIERVESYDRVSGVRLVSEYRYHHGYYDGDEREFRGFGMVEQVDTEAFSAAPGLGLFPEVTAQNGELPQPPVLTKTWFHVGAWKKGAAISRQYESEYYGGDEAAPRLPDTVLPDGLTPEERRQACRALRGQVLRQEVYALDGSPREPHPYSVVENSFSVRREQPLRGEAPGVFFVSPREAISLYYERYLRDDGKLDPRVTHAFTLDVDVHGTVRKSVALAYPRRIDPVDEDYAAQQQLAVTLTETDVLHLAGDPHGYRLGIPIETRTYEIHWLAPPAAGVFSFEDIALIDPPGSPAPPREYEAWPPDENEPPPSRPQKRLIERVCVRYYDSEGLPSPMPPGTADVRALPYESYQLALTPGQIATKLNADQERVTPAILAEGGYVELQDQVGWWIPSGRQVFDPTRFFLPTSVIDPWGATVTVEYDAHALLVTRTEDALGNQVTIENDYRTLSPVLITDPNGNRSAVRLDELGMVVATAVMGKAGSTDGDTLDDPTTTIEVDLFRFQTTGKPNRVRTRAREAHGDPATRWQESYSYSDGSGREVMRKVQAEPGLAPVLDADGHLVLDQDGAPLLAPAMPRWVGTGRTVFDNKGNPIKQYEPYFSRTHEYEDNLDLVQWGVTPILRYDPLGRLVRTDYPNGTCARVAFTPWSQTSWDANDTVLDPGNLWFAARQAGATPAPSPAEQRAASLAAAHAGTPTVVELDPLGRPFLSIADLGGGGGGTKVRTRTTLDIEGNPLVVTDGRGNAAMVHTFDVAGRKLHQNSIDAGARWMLADVLGNPLRVWDSRGHMVRTAYDVLRRPTGLWVQKDGGAEVLAERTVYGEAHPDAAALNLRGKVWKQYDGAGLVTSEGFDFNGNLLGSSRRLATDYKNQLDWSQSPGPTLEAEAFTSTTAYDALNRPISITRPDQSEIRPVYNEAGLLEAIDVRLRGTAAWTAFVEDIDYDAKGQRERIVYGNGVITEYSYDPLTFRLTRIKTTRPSDGAVLQDLRYTHDPVGNIIEITDHAQSTIYYNNQVVEPVSRYEYDALYRLTRAEGREHAGQNADIQQDHLGYPLVNSPHPNDPQALRNYTELYQYDAVGNILAMSHQAGTGGWTRRYEIAPGSNRLLSTSLPGDGEDAPYSAKYTYNEHGSTTSMPHLASIGWDFKEQQREVDLGGGGKAYYVYDATGERVRKAWEHSGFVEERIYLGAYEVYRRREGAQAELVLERQTLHVMDNARRIAMVETKTVDASVPPAAPTQRLRFQIENHLGSAVMELDELGLVISYEEYHPYGTTSYRATKSGAEVSAKRYRYAGRELDDETGLNYHSARYSANWLGRWTSADPLGMVDTVNLYCSCNGNPVTLADPEGTQSRVIHVNTRPNENVSAWIPGKSKTTLTAHSEAELETIAAGRPIFKYDPNAGQSAERAAMLLAAEELSSQLTSVLRGSTAGSGTKSGSGSSVEAPKKEETAAEAVARGLALAGAAASLDAPERQAGGSPYGVVGGSNPNAESSPFKQAVFGGVQVAIAAVDVSGIAKAAARAVLDKITGSASREIVEKAALEAAEKAAKEGGDSVTAETVERAAQQAAEKAAKQGWIEAGRAAEERGKSIINQIREEARTAAHESGRHTWPRRAAQELEREADKAEKAGMLREYVEKLRTMAETMRKREAGHRGGISGRGAK